MPIAFEYPIPKIWKDFERMLRDLHPEMSFYGREGQDQDGIDLVSNDFTHVIQAKKQGLGIETIKIDQIASWIQRAKAFYEKVPFQRLTLATTQKTDKNLQLDLWKYHLSHCETIPFKVDILFWDSIEELFIERPELVRKYYLTELYDPNVIADFKSGSLDAYIKTTLFGKIVVDKTGQSWPSIDFLIDEMHSRIHSGYGHKLNIDSLLDDYQPIKRWCDLILVEARCVEKNINIDFSQHDVLPIEWASFYLQQLREMDLVAVLETEMELLSWIRIMQKLLNFIKLSGNPRRLDGSHTFSRYCDEACSALRALKSCISDNAEALSAYKSLQENLRKRGMPEFDINVNVQERRNSFGYYGYRLSGNGIGEEYLYCVPLEKNGVNAKVILQGTKGLRYPRTDKCYFKPLPEHDKITVMQLSD